MRWFEIQEMARIADKELYYFDDQGHTLTQDELEKADVVFASRSKIKEIIAKINAKMGWPKGEGKQKQVAKEVSASSGKDAPQIRVMYAPFSLVRDDIESVTGPIKLYPAEVDNAAAKKVLSTITGDPDMIRGYVEVLEGNQTVYLPIVFNTDKGVANKSFDPGKFDFGGKEFANAGQLANEVIAKLKTNVENQTIQDLLIQLVEVAIDKRPAVDKNLMDFILADPKSFANISKDFGEILAPLVVAKDNSQAISFPGASNEKMVDVTIGGKKVAVKSLSGSGNGMDGISSFIDAYEEKMDGTESEDKKKLFNFVKANRTKKSKVPGITQDGKGAIVYSTFLVPTREAEAIEEMLGGRPTDHKSLINLVQAYYDKNLKDLDPKEAYVAWLERLKPISIVSGYGKQLKDRFKLSPLGLPADYRKYVDFEDIGIKKVGGGKEQRTGFPLYRKNFVVAAASNLVYMLGVSSNALYNSKTANPTEEAKKMEDLMTEIMSNQDAYAAHVTIKKDGTLEVDYQHFKDLRFGFQYHAATNAPARNLPGYHIIFKK